MIINYAWLNAGHISKQKMQKVLATITIALFFYGCVKDKPNAPVPKSVQLSNSKKVFIVNEGGYNNGNASISLYDPGNDEVIEDFYGAQNSSALGDVAQSMSYINGSYYIVVNNSGKIIVCNQQFKKTSQINGLTSPRYILPVTNQKAYVSDLYSNAISVINLNTNIKTGSIACFGKTERMVLLYNKVFVTNYDRDYVYVINTIKDQVEDSVFVGKNASSIISDKEDKIWVLSPTKLSRINSINHQVEAAMSFPATDSPYNLCCNKGKDTLYYINSSVYRMEITATALPVSAFIVAGNKNFYGLLVNPNDFNVYVADALDYVQRSNVYIFGTNGDQKKVIKAGINSNGFYFE